jgi:hypothetical protein
MERLTLGHLVPSSESAGNTQAAPESAVLAQTAPGSASVLPPSPTSDVVVNTVGGTVRDHAKLITDGGEPGSRPAQDHGWATEFQRSEPWRQV